MTGSVTQCWIFALFCPPEADIQLLNQTLAAERDINMSVTQHNFGEVWVAFVKLLYFINCIISRFISFSF